MECDLWTILQLQFRIFPHEGGKFKPPNTQFIDIYFYNITIMTAASKGF